MCGPIWFSVGYVKQSPRLPQKINQRIAQDTSYSFTAIINQSLEPQINQSRYSAQHFTSTMAMEVDDGSGSSIHEDVRWSLEDELDTLIEDALKLSFSELEQERPMLFSSKEEYGDYECENVFSIWPEFAEKPEHKHPDIKKPTYVGEEIKKHIEKRDDMIKQVSVHDVGIVTFRLSGKWIAESIRKMLRAGIETWAPKLYVGRVMISSPSWFAPEQTRLSLCRRTYILNTLARMLEYIKVDLIIFQESSQEKVDKDKAEGKVKECFLVEERDGNVTISVGPEGERKPLFRGKKDGGFGNAYTDLSNLWYGLDKEKADWIIYVSPVQQQEYLELCFTAARHAKWLPKDRYKSPSVSYAGYQTCSKEVEQIINFFNQLQEESVESPTTVLSNALTYTFLENHRLAVCTFNSNEMGSTLKHLLETQDQICSYTLKFRKEIDALKASELTLGKGEILEEGVERVLGLHLLKFTEVLRESCLSILPHILCKYLHDLCDKFDRCRTFYGSCVSEEVGFVAEPTARLLLYKATEVVMEKCIHLLGIASESSSSEVSIAQSLLAQSSAKRAMDVNVLVADMESDNKKQKKVVVGGTSEDTIITRLPSPIARDPPKNPRFEPISILLNITSDSEFKKGKLLGNISVSDTLGLLSDEWVQSYEPDCCHVSLFNREWFESIDINNYGYLHFGNTSSRHSVAISSSMEICIRIYVSTENKDDLYQLCDHQSDIDFLKFWEKDGDSTCGALMATGVDGHVLMHYILLKDAVDAALELTCTSLADNLKVYGEIYAYYGSNFDHESDDEFLNNFYMSLLYRDDPDSVSSGAKVPLRKSVMAVPNKGGSLLIHAKLTDESGNVILNNSYDIPSQTGGSVGVDLKGTGCLFRLKVEWSQGPGCRKGGSYLLQV